MEKCGAPAVRFGAKHQICGGNWYLDMTITTHTEQLKTKGRNDCIDITETVQHTVKRANIQQGLATIFVTGSTAGVTTIEY